MRVLSIDIGIKHLAHCLFEVTDKIRIVSWDVIDVSTHGTCHCGNKATHQCGDLFLCKPHTSLINKSIIEVICLSKKHDIPLGTKKEMCALLKKETIPIQSTMTDIGTQLIKQYASIHADIVLIENQIGPIASKMKAVQGMVLQYWLMRDAKVECISPVNKLKLFHKEKTTYAERKKLSIQYTKETLALNQIDDSHFLKHKKKDDLADTFLQGIWYFYNINCRLLKLNCS